MTTQSSGAGDPKRSLELLWGLRDSHKSGPKRALSAATVAAAAVELADTEGLSAVAMRRVADRLGVSTMSLYTYVHGKAELIDLMLDRVYGEPLAACAEPATVRVRLETLARDVRTLYLRHPWILQVARRRPTLGPNLMARYEHHLRCVEGLGLSDVEMDQSLSLIIAYVGGAVRATMEARQAEQATGQTDAEWWADRAPLFEKVFDPQRFPTAARVGAAVGADYEALNHPDRVFEFGLARLLDGLDAFIALR
jgi:AcrR family transcriptional regulator